MDNKGLLDQFAQLQEEQHRKFARMKQKQVTQHTSAKMEKGESFGISDDLQLDTGDVMASSTVGLNVSLEAANTNMREEIRELRDETGRLRKVMAEREHEIKRLNKKLSKMEEDKRLLSEAGIASDAASSKIVELSKKNRELTATMESERSKSMRLQQRAKELELKLAISSDGKHSDDVKGAKFQHASLQETPRAVVENLQEQLGSANLKLADYRNQVQALKQELKVAQKVLSQEIGDTQLNIQLLLSSGGQGYRGRAQQVMALQSKVKELEQKLKSSGSFSPKEDRNMARIKTMERARKEQNDTLREDLAKLQEQNSELQRKVDASKARGKVLAGEVKSLKAQAAVLTDKGAHDNELILTLTKQQDRLQKLLERHALNQNETKRNEQMVTKELHDRQQQEAAEVSNLKRLVLEKEERVKELEQTLMEVRSDHWVSEHKPLDVFSFPANSSIKARRESPRPPVVQMSPNSASEQEMMRLRSKITELEALYATSDIEQGKLTELVEILNTRLREAISKVERSISEQHDLRRKCALLEQQLDSTKTTQRNAEDKELTFHSLSAGKVPERETLKKDLDGIAAGNSNVNDAAICDSLRAQLSIQVDENNALKEALQSTLASKREDAALFGEMSDQTKQVFLDALRSFGNPKKQ